MSMFARGLMLPSLAAVMLSGLAPEIPGQERQRRQPRQRNANVKAYELQDREHKDTVEANLALGFDADVRDYGVGAQILYDLGIRRLRLLTNNMGKYVGLKGYGLEIAERVPLELPPHEDNREYLRTKKQKMGHLLKSV